MIEERVTLERKPRRERDQYRSQAADAQRGKEYAEQELPFLRRTTNEGVDMIADPMARSDEGQREHYDSIIHACVRKSELGRRVSLHQEKIWFEVSNHDRKEFDTVGGDYDRSCLRAEHTGAERTCERMLWKARVRELEHENQRLEHNAYLQAQAASLVSSSNAAGTSFASDTRTLRQQLAWLDERCQSFTSKATKLQEQVADARRLLAQERQERLDERNKQLTVVVAKHGLERRLRNREQDLQDEWRRNAELTERCRKLEQDLERSKKVGTGHNQDQASSSRDEGLPTRLVEASPPEDDWSETPSHVPPEYGYSKFVRWKKKRDREGHTRDSSDVTLHKRVCLHEGFESRKLQLAGSESPPQGTMASEQVDSGASAIDHMIHGEFIESESLSGADASGHATNEQSVVTS